MKNGLMKLSGFYKYGNDGLSDVKIILALKYWDYEYSEIPNCYYAWSDNMIIFFDDDKSRGEMKLVGKLCNAGSDQWQTFRGDYIIVDGDVEYSDGMGGKGVIELLINQKTGHVLSGKMSGNIILYT